MQKIITLITLTTLIMTGCQRQDGNDAVTSPDGEISYKISVSDKGDLTYSISSGGQVLLEPSTLGLVSTGEDLTKGLQVVSASPVETVTTEYRLVTGKQLANKATFNKRIYELASPAGTRIDLEVRAFNDGIAFRYLLPDSQDDSIHIISESTSFNLPQPGRAWMHPYDAVTKYAPAYETYYTDDLSIGDPAPDDKNGWAFPALFEVGRHWVLLSEAGHDGSYPAMHMDAESASGNYTMRLPEPEETYNDLPATKSHKTPWALPWRTILIGDSLGEIVESNLVTHVNEPNKLKDMSWIQPGRSSWSWWSDNNSPQDYEKLKRFVDFSAEMGWEYSLVDANWNIMEGGDLKSLAEYASTKGVGLLVWYNSGGEHNIVTEMPRDRMWDADIRRQEFKKLQDWGIKGIKVDFFQSDKPDIIRQYINILEDAAEFKLMVNFHGCTLPKGWRRTYPNLVTMESIRGGECYIFAAEYPLKAGVHLNIATYTRNVVGPMDYTPVGISYLKYPHLTSYAFELAQGVVFESGIQHLCDDPDAYRGLPDFAHEYLQDLPVAWDETRFIDGYPGDFTIIARRSGKTWYVAGMNGQDATLRKQLDLSFLPDSAKSISLITGTGKEQLDFVQVSLSHDKTITVDLENLGGFVGWVTLP